MGEYDKLIRDVHDLRNKVDALVARAKVPWFKGTSAPTTGNWSVGDIIWNKNVSNSGDMGWVCVSGGSPGVWTPFSGGGGGSEGPGIDILGSAVGLGGDTILIYHADGSPVTEFAPTDAGLDEAGAAISSENDIIVTPPVIFTADHTFVGCKYELFGTTFTGHITMSANTLTDNGVFARTGVDTKVICVTAPATGNATMFNPLISAITSSMSGLPACGETNDGELYIYYGRVSCFRGGADYPPFTSGLGSVGAFTELDDTVFTFDTDAQNWAWAPIWDVEHGGDHGAWRNQRLEMWELTPVNDGGSWGYSWDSYHNTPLVARVGAYISFDECHVADEQTVGIRVVWSGSHYWEDAEGENWETTGAPATHTHYILNEHDYYSIGWIFVWVFGTSLATEGNPVWIDNIRLHGFGVLAALGKIYHYGLAGVAINQEQLPGDLSAFDALGFQSYHANDIDTASGIHHTLGTGATQAAAGSHVHDGTDITSGTADEGDVLTADGAGGVSWEPGNFAFLPTVWMSDAPPAQADAMDDEFDDNSIGALWTVFAPGSSLAAQEVGRGLMLTQQAVTADYVEGYIQPYPSGNDHTFSIKVSLDSYWDTAITAGIVLGEDIDSPPLSDLILYGIKRSTETNNNGIQAMYLDDYATWADNYVEDVYDGASGNFVSTLYLRIRLDGTNAYLEWSSDGITWISRYSFVMPWTPEFVGVAVRIGSGLSDVPRAIFGWFRHRSLSTWGHANNGRRVHIAVLEGASESPSVSPSATPSPSGSESPSSSESPSDSPSESPSSSESVSESASESPSEP